MNNESLIGTLLQTLGSSGTGELSRQIGSSDSQTSSALEVAIPLLIGALGKNAQKDEEARDIAEAVRKDHSGALLDNLGGYLSTGGNRTDGSAILKHVLGGKRDNAERGIARATGLEEGQAGALLEILAPVVLGALGKKQQEEGLDVGGLAGVLLGERQRAQSSDSPIGALITEILDSNDDGSILDDIVNMVMRFFGGDKR